VDSPSEPSLEYSSDSSYHKAVSADEGWIRIIPVGELEVIPDASGPEIPSDAALEEEEESEGSSAENRSMSPLHQEEEGPAIISHEEMELMSRVLDEQPILGNAVSGQRCIRSAGSLPLSKYHPYVRSSFFKGQLRGLPSSEAFRSNYLRARRTGRVERSSCGGEADDECSGFESIRSSVEPEGLADSSCTRVIESGNGSDPDPTTLATCVLRSHGDGRGIGWSWNFGRRDLG